MPDLFERKVYRLYLVSEKTGRLSLFQLQRFKSGSFNQEIDENKLKDTLTDLVKDIYGQSAGGRWIGINDTDAVSEEDTLYIEFGCSCRLEIRNIIESIDLQIVDGVNIRYFILLNTISRKFRWVVASKTTVYSDCEKKSENETNKNDPDHYLAFLNAMNGEQ